MALMSCI